MKFDLEFWNSTTEEYFQGLAKKLLAKGFTEQEVKDILETIYHVVAGEFGA